MNVEDIRWERRDQLMALINAMWQFQSKEGDDEPEADILTDILHDIITRGPGYVSDILLESSAMIVGFLQAQAELNDMDAGDLLRRLSQQVALRET